MCGRYATTRTALDLSTLFEAEDEVEALEPTWNAAPTDPVPVVRLDQRGHRVLRLARWGLVPPWSKDARGAARMINARAETVARTPAFARAFAQRRCLVPADGWYEWRLENGRRQPYFLTPADGAPLVFAGLAATWHPPAGPPLATCSIVTMAAAGPLTAVHDRMPLLLENSRWEQWLSGEPGPELLRPPSAAQLAGIELRPVGRAVGNVRNNGPALVARVETGNDLTLFDAIFPDSSP
jgi:putative SOS response-associated peptidase YedK